MPELTDLTVEEISLVGKPANGQRFILYKSEGGAGETIEVVAASAYEIAMEKARTLVAKGDGKLSETDALVQVFRAEPELVAQHRAEVLGEYVSPRMEKAASDQRATEEAARPSIRPGSALAAACEIAQARLLAKGVESGDITDEVLQVMRERPDLHAQHRAETLGF